mmetsp:Transcript_13776/g.36559  ORF Transcript_13776/g.36559 Transcript_13776/m.36559 type:complete len:80 (-) Transcript_13776:299-538(-)
MRRLQSSPCHPASHAHAYRPPAPVGTHLPWAPQLESSQPYRLQSSPCHGGAHSQLPSPPQRPWPEHSTQPPAGQPSPSL